MIFELVKKVRICLFQRDGSGLFVLWTIFINFIFSCPNLHSNLFLFSFFLQDINKVQAMLQAGIPGELTKNGFKSPEQKKYQPLNGWIQMEGIRNKMLPNTFCVPQKLGNIK